MEFTVYLKTKIPVKRIYYHFRLLLFLVASVADTFGSGVLDPDLLYPDLLYPDLLYPDLLYPHLLYPDLADPTFLPDYDPDKKGLHCLKGLKDKKVFSNFLTQKNILFVKKNLFYLFILGQNNI